MADFKFLQNPLLKKWIILAPHRAKRPDISNGGEPICPFCAGKEKESEELYRIGGLRGDSNWQVRVVANKFPFAPVHEIIINSPDHHKNFDEFSKFQIEMVLQAYRQRYNIHKDKGQVYIFHNRGESGGESLPHSHTQLVVIPSEVNMDIPRLDPLVSVGYAPRPGQLEKSQKGVSKKDMVVTDDFYLFCPQTSQWPDEVWAAPKKRGKTYGEITDEEITDLSFILPRVIQIFSIRHGNEFPFNFYIYPGNDWYLRIIPRVKRLGGFEIGTGIFVNTQDPDDTLSFIKEHFDKPNEEKIRVRNQAEYRKGV